MRSSMSSTSASASATLPLSSPTRSGVAASSICASFAPAAPSILISAISRSPSNASLALATGACAQAFERS
ncbi:hypothetical protein B5G20_07400 [Collinsella sp. An7]|nr:hypothetical protein B5G20_07400 [Collinsella sp. An7]